MAFKRPECISYKTQWTIAVVVQYWLIILWNSSKLLLENVPIILVFLFSFTAYLNYFKENAAWDARILSYNANC